MIAGLTLKLLFTKLERYLLLNQARPFVLRDNGVPDENDDSINQEAIEELKPKSKHYKQLLKGLYHKEIPQLEDGFKFKKKDRSE